MALISIIVQLIDKVNIEKDLLDKEHFSVTYRNIVGHKKMVKYEPTTHNMLKHRPTRRPNVRNILRPTILRYAALACCDRLAGAL